LSAVRLFTRCDSGDRVFTINCGFEDHHMKSVAFTISSKENERRRALLPGDLAQVCNSGFVFLEQGYGEVLGIADEEYRKAGAQVVPRHDAFKKDIICTMKAPEADERELLQHGQTVFGWIHAVQGREITDFLCERGMSAVAWEDMFEDGEHVFWRNQELAGEAAIYHSMLHLGRSPEECNAAIIGRGQCARGAFRALSRLGARIRVYTRVTVHNLRNHLHEYDMIVNAVLWDISRNDRIIYREDLKRMRPGSMIVDISCDTALEIETSRATTIADPVYTVDGIIHYAVDHAPAILHRSVSPSISKAICKYIDPLIQGSPNKVLGDATVIKDGVIIDHRIKQFQKR